MPQFRSFLKSITLPLRTFSRAGGLLFSTSRGMHHLGLKNSLVDLIITTSFAIIFGIVTYRARKQQVQIFFQNPQEQESIILSGKKAYVLRFFKATNYLTLPGLLISGVLSSLTITNNVDKLLSLIFNLSREVHVGLDIVGLLIGILAGLCVCLVFVAFQGAETEKYVHRLFVREETINRKVFILTMILGCSGSIAISIFAYFCVVHGLDQTCIAINSIFHLKIDLTDHAYLLSKQLLGILTGVVTLFSMGVSNNMALYDVLKNNNVKNNIMMAFKEAYNKSKINFLILCMLSTLFSLTMFLQFFSSSADTILCNFFQKNENLLNLSADQAALVWVFSILIGISGGLLFVVFNRKGFAISSDNQRHSSFFRNEGINNILITEISDEIRYEDNQNLLQEQQNKY